MREGIAVPILPCRARFVWDVLEDTEISGPMALRLCLELQRTNDACLFVGVQKLRAGRVVPFEGGYGYGYDRVSTGWLRVSLRALDADLSTPWRPEHAYDEFRVVGAGEIVPVEIALPPSATLFRAGEQARLVVQGRWFSSRNPLLGQFPAAYKRGPEGSCVFHCGGRHEARLKAPVTTP